MDVHIPTDLIRQVQLSLRTSAGLACYEPDDPTLPALPSLRESVAAFDPSPAYLRCKHCHGRLVRGLQSVICVYCGRRQPKDVPPEPIAFKSTVGYQWLLHSLDLDGSEVVGPLIEDSELNSRQSTPKDEILLSELLNVEWPAEQEKIERSVSNDASVQSNSSMNLAGVLDEFFVHRKDHVSDLVKEHTVTSKHTENMTLNSFASQENLGSFLTAVSSSEAKDDDNFSGWEADFQSAGSATQPEASKSFDPSVYSGVDLSTHIESVFGSAKPLEDDDPNNASILSVSATSDWPQDDLWNNSNFLASHKAEQVETTIKGEDDMEAGNIIPASVDWLPDDQWQSHNTTATDNKTITENDDSFDVWNDFTSSYAQDLSSTFRESTIQNADGGEQTSDSMFPSLTDNFNKMDFGSFSESDLLSGSVSKQNDVVKVNKMQPEVSASDSMASEEVGVGDVVGDVGVAFKGGDIFNSTVKSEDDIKSLFSQMHDLSFMLKSDLSVPLEKDDLIPPQD